jgi:pimeloyl-ACP methyl ester carboxylesterase
MREEIRKEVEMKSEKITKGVVFGGFPMPEGVEMLGIRASVGVLTAMRCRAEGEVRGVALLIPGFTGAKEDFYKILPLLAAHGWDVWTYSQRGQADSAAPFGRENYTRELGIKDALEVAGVILEETGAQKIHLLGHSYGGLIVQGTAIAGPQLFASVTLMCSGPHGWPGRHADLYQRLLTDPRDSWTIDHPTFTPEQYPGLSAWVNYERLRSARTSHEELISVLDQLNSVHDTSFELRDTKLPVLVFHGQNDDAWPQEWQKREAWIVGGRYEIIPEAGHLPNMDNPEATAELLDDFWGSVQG